MALIPLFYTGSVVHAKDDGVSEMSLYQRASELSREFGSGLAPGSDNDMNMILDRDGALILPGNAGGFVGYADVKSDDGVIVGWFTSSFTTSSSTITYDQLTNLIPSDNANEVNPFMAYAGYGEALTNLSLAKTVRPNGVTSMGRTVATYLTLGMYMLANVAPFLMLIALQILMILNPFKFFSTVFDGVAAADLGFISGIATEVGDLYVTVQEFSLYVLFPLLLVLTLFGAILLAKGTGMKLFARYAVRVFMLFAGLPLIGATYTGVVEDLGANASVGSDFADYLVHSTYVDFEQWARKSRLAPPDMNVAGMITNPRFSDVTSRKVSSRDMILEINAQGAKSKVAKNLQVIYRGSLGDAFKDGMDGQQSISDTDSGAKWGETGSTTPIPGQPSMNDNGASGTSQLTAMNRFGATFALLVRHAHTDVYTGSQYDGEVSGQIQGIRDADDDELDKEIAKMFMASSSRKVEAGYKSEKWAKGKADWNDAQGLFSYAGADPSEDSKKHFTYGDYADGVLKYNIHNGGSLDLNGDGGAYTSSGNETSQTLAPVGSTKSLAVGGLSPLAMYNFLNTTFTETGLTVFSPVKSASDMTRDAYASVTFGVSGMNGLMRWTENLIVMISVSVLAIAFGGMMIGAAIKGVPRILTSVFGTALGSIAMTTKLLISTAVMILQILGLMFFYAVSEKLLIGFLVNVDMLTTQIEAFFGSSGILLDYARGVIVNVVTVVLTIFLIKNAGVFREMMEEVVTTAITKVMGLLDTSTGGKGLDAGHASSGRMGNDGKLKEDKLAKNNPGMLGSAANLMGEAHDIESKREDAADSMGLDKRSAGGKMAARLGSFGDLASSDRMDKMAGALGIRTGEGDGKFTGMGDRKRKRKADNIQALGHGEATDRGKNVLNNYKKGTPGGREELARNEALENAADGTGTDDKTNQFSTNSSGQMTDSDNNVIMNDDGNAINANGDAISPNAPISNDESGGVLLGDGGVMLDADGEAYTDELGNEMYMNDDGHLVDSDGELSMIDNAGHMVPLDDGEDPVNAVDGANELDGKRHDAEAYDNMTNAQEAAHHGMDSAGNPTGIDGEPLQYEDSNGDMQNAELDDDGFITDKHGNRLSSDELSNSASTEGFDSVVDPRTGQEHIKHKGDGANRAEANSNKQGATGSQKQSLTSLAKQSNKAQQDVAVAEKALDKLKQQGAGPEAIKQGKKDVVSAKSALKNMRMQGAKPDALAQGERAVTGAKKALKALNDNGASPEAINKGEQAVAKAEKNLATMSKRAASPSEINKAKQAVFQASKNLNTISKPKASNYAVEQAQRNVESTKRRAENSQQKFSGALEKSQRGDNSESRPSPRISQDHVQSATRNAGAQRASMQKEQQTLKDMQASGSGATPKQISDQTRKVRSQGAKTRKAENAATNTQIAHDTGRTLNEVQTTRKAEARAETAYARAQSNHADAVQSGQPDATIERLAQARDTASTNYSKARDDTSRVVQKPQGSPQQIDRAVAEHEHSSNNYRQAQQEVSDLRSKGGSRRQIKQAEKKAQRARNKMNQATARKTQVLNPKGGAPNSPKITPIPPKSQDDSFDELVTNGQGTYETYQADIQKQRRELNSNLAKVKQTKQRIAEMRKTGRPKQVIDTAVAEVATYESNARANTNKIDSMKGNAHGLLKSGKFRPNIADRPVRQHGGKVVNDLIHLNQTQILHDKLSWKAKRTPLSRAETTRLSQLDNSLKSMRQGLVKSGIREDAIKDSKSISRSTRDMKHSWDSFMNGDSAEIDK